MKIIETARAPNPRRLRIFLAEKAVTVAFEEHDLMAKAFQTPEFSALNPWQQVPLLVFDDGRTIAESVAICRYFEETHPEPPLFGSGAYGKANVEMWNRRVELGLFSAVAQVFRHLHPRMAHLEVPQVATWGEVNKDKIEIELSRLDARLARSGYLADGGFSIADITMLVAVDFMKPARLPFPDRHGHIMRWYEEVSSRPSASA